MAKAAKAFAMFLLLLCLPLMARQIDDPQRVSYVGATIEEKGTVEVSGGSPERLTIRFPIPISSPYQQVEYEGEPQYDSQGNPYWRMVVDDPPNPYSYSKTIKVTTTARRTAALPSNYTIGPEFSNSLRPNADVQSDSKEIRELALRITENASTQFGKVAALAIFVNEYIRYDMSLAGEKKDALWVLQNRRGVCLEYATLFAALSRSIGIPTRYVVGYAYSESLASFIGHAWNEAYIGNWVAVDPTWLEVGALDALHLDELKTTETLGSAEPSRRLDGEFTGASPTVHWEYTGQESMLASNIALDRMEYDEPDPDFTLKLVEPYLPIGGTTLAYFSVEGKDYRVVPISLDACRGEGGVSVDNSYQYLVTEPGRNYTLVWPVRVSGSLSGSYTYDCPLTLNSPYFERRKATLHIDPRLRSLSIFGASIREKSPLPGEENGVLLTLAQDRRGKDYYLLTESGVLQQRIEGASGTLPFVSGATGQPQVYVAGEGGGYQQLSYSSGPQSGISIDSVSFPQFMVEGKQAKAEIALSAESYPADFQLELFVAGGSANLSGSMGGPQKLEVPFVPQAAGAQQANARVFSGWAAKEKPADEKNAIATVLAAPSVSISGVEITKDSEGLLAHISFSTPNSPLSPTARINGWPYNIVQGSVEARLPEGEYTAYLSWSDAAGNQYSGEESLAVEDPGIAGVIGDAKQKATPSGAPGACPLAAALLISLASFAFIRQR